MSKAKETIEYVVEWEDEYETYGDAQSAIERAQYIRDGYEEIGFTNVVVKVFKVETTESLLKTFKTKEE